MSLGNAWHIPGSTEALPNFSMRDPIFPTDLNSPVRIFNGNQFAGGAGGANQNRNGQLCDVQAFRGQCMDKSSDGIC